MNDGSLGALAFANGDEARHSKDTAHAGQAHVAKLPPAHVRSVLGVSG